MERWMKVMTHETGDFVGSLVIDQLIKTIIVKLDSVFAIKDEITDREGDEFKDKMRKFK